jgi:hypothetical protein
VKKEPVFPQGKPAAKRMFELDSVLTNLFARIAFRRMSAEPLPHAQLATHLARIINKQSRCGILPHNREERQDAAATFLVYE